MQGKYIILQSQTANYRCDGTALDRSSLWAMLLSLFHRQAPSSTPLCHTLLSSSKNPFLRFRLSRRSFSLPQSYMQLPLTHSFLPSPQEPPLSPLSCCLIFVGLFFRHSFSLSLYQTTPFPYKQIKFKNDTLIALCSSITINDNFHERTEIPNI